jgi:hypothetical protein
LLLIFRQEFNDPTPSTVNWKKFSSFEALCNQQPEEEEIVVLPQRYFNKDDVGKEMEMAKQPKS